MSYDIGDAVPLAYTINNTATVVLTVTAPSGTTTNPTTTPSGVAPAVTYSASVLVDQAGTWLYRFVATGTVTDSEDGSFQVQPAADARVYTTRPEVKERLSIPLAKTQHDGILDGKIRTASRMIDQDCQRHFWKVTETRALAAADPYRVRLLEFMDLVSVTTLKTDAGGDGTFEQTWTAADYQLLCDGDSPNINAGPEPRPYTRIRAVGSLRFPIGSGAGRFNLVEITGTWGWPQVPDDIREACEVAAAELFALKDTTFGAAGVGDLGIIRVRENSHYQRLLRPYKHIFAVA
jgi:hypothetical protein